ncbi:MAG TPA: Uma2 family endonuclease [Gemmataceae bacterium]|nr:Uma2 family endonuclease [Gemmataceae bacterium]
MSILTKPYLQPEIDYPDDDGLPMADNTVQFEWIVIIKGGLDAVFRNDPNVFVAGNLLWYPVEGDNKTRTAPDDMVVFGRPKKGYRGSYRQWEEGNIAPQVVFEILSPGNRVPDMDEKFAFYDRYGVEEYYLYDPETPELKGWLRKDGKLQPIREPGPWISPRLKIRFEMGEDGLIIYDPDGKPFASYVELVEQREKEREEKEKIREEKEKERLEKEKMRLENDAERLERKKRGEKKK